MYRNEVYPIKKRSLRNFKFTRKKESLRNLKNHLQKKRKLGKRHLGIHDHLHQIFYFYNTLYFFYLLKCHLLRTSLNFNHHCDDEFFGLIIYFSIYFHQKKKISNKHHKNLSKPHVNFETFQNHPKSENKPNEKNLNGT
jgi:hypothetical protein